MSFRPVGTSIESQFRIIPDRTLVPELHQALKAISRVHGDGVLPSMVLDLLVLNPPNVSQLNINRHTLQPQAILVSPSNRTRRLGVLHEVGHLLDWSGFEPVGQFSSALGLFSGWQDAILQTPTVLRLQQIAREGMVVEAADHLVTIEAAIPLAQYFLRPEELFARSYAQYIVSRAQNSLLENDLDLIRQKSPLMLLSQWEDAEFMQIAAEFDRLFLERGWLQ